MILADTSIWIDHLRKGDALLMRRLESAQVLAHPFVTGEIALGSLRQREVVISALGDLPQANVATEEEVLRFVERERLFGLGLGFVDVHLLAAIRLTSGSALWTRDKRLAEAAARLGLAAPN